MRYQDRRLILFWPVVVVAFTLLATAAVLWYGLASATEEYVEPLCNGEYHNHGSTDSMEYPMPVKILGFSEQEATNGWPEGAQWIRVHVNPGSGEVPFRTRVVWSTHGMSRCEACGVWGGEVPLDGNREVELYDDSTPLELRCLAASGDPASEMSVSMQPRYLPRPQAELQVEPHD